MVCHTNLKLILDCWSHLGSGKEMDFCSSNMACCQLKAIKILFNVLEKSHQMYNLVKAEKKFSMVWNNSPYTEPVWLSLFLSVIRVYTLIWLTFSPWIPLCLAFRGLWTSENMGKFMYTFICIFWWFSLWLSGDFQRGPSLRTTALFYLPPAHKSRSMPNKKY